MRLYEVKADGVTIGFVPAKNKQDAIEKMKNEAKWEAYGGSGNGS